MARMRVDSGGRCEPEFSHFAERADVDEYGRTGPKEFVKRGSRVRIPEAALTFHSRICLPNSFSCNLNCRNALREIRTSGHSGIRVACHQTATANGPAALRATPARTPSFFGRPVRRGLCGQSR